jgi:hypothetical protein
MQATESFTTSKRSDRLRSLHGPAALADTADTYFQAFAALRAVLEGAPTGHAQAVLDAAEDIAESHVERQLSGGGAGQ